MPNDDLQQAQLLGQLIGEVKALNMGLNQRFDDLKEQIERQDRSHTQRMDKFEKAITDKVDGLDKRVKHLEEAETINKVTLGKFGLMLGGGTSALTILAVELLKRVH